MESKKLVLTHFYPVAERYDLVSQCAKVFHGKVQLAKDLTRIKIKPKIARVIGGGAGT